ncbi:MAG: DUF1292 domain-containing protein [Filifactoraceae bacterium]
MDNMNDEVIVLVDEDGNEVEFELVMSLEAQGNQYAILLPVEELEDEEEEAYIFRMEEDEEGEIALSAIEDDEEYEMVVSVYENLVLE